MTESESWKEQEVHCVVEDTGQSCIPVTSSFSHNVKTGEMLLKKLKIFLQILLVGLEVKISEDVNQKTFSS